MIIHIVKNGEDIDNILSLYKVTLEELKVYNSHLTNFKSLIPGSKLLIPFLSLENEQILKRTESFIADYYPILDSPDKESASLSDDKIVSSVSKSKPINNGRPYPGITPPIKTYSGHIIPKKRV